MKISFIAFVWSAFHLHYINSLYCSTSSAFALSSYLFHLFSCIFRLVLYLQTLEIIFDLAEILILELKTIDTFNVQVPFVILYLRLFSYLLSLIISHLFQLASFFDAFRNELLNVDVLSKSQHITFGIHYLLSSVKQDFLHLIFVH